MADRDDAMPVKDPAEAGVESAEAGPDDGKRSYKRRQYIVDKQLQYYYLSAWLSAVVLFILVGFAFFVLFKVNQDTENLDQDRLDLVYRMLLLNSVFLILFSILMGLHSILHTHRIAGAAYHIREALKNINARKYRPIVLRKKDYLKDVAEEINRLQDRLLAVEKTKEDVIQQLDSVQGELSEPARKAMADVRQKVAVL